ncbi:MAG: Trk system potassium transporter TrkA, partial [Proteobacteria bacterium]
MRFVIIGAGDVGANLCVKLASHQHDVILIEKRLENISKQISSLDLQIIIGNGSCPEVLSRAGIEAADYVIAVTDSDEVNVAACFISRLINPEPKRIARLRDLEIAHRSINPELLSEYFDLIINPDQAGAEYLLR